MEIIGLQLYSLRDYLEPGIETMLRKVADCGFNAVEYAGYYDRQPSELYKLVTSLGLRSYSTHVPFRVIKEKGIPRVIEDARELKLRYVICSGNKMNTHEDIGHTAEVMRELHRQAKEHGMIAGYHNHEHEFRYIDGRYIMDLLLEAVDAEDFVAEIDTCWAAFAGVDPVNYIAELGVQAGPLHFKDLAVDFDIDDRLSADAPFGDGLIDFAGILRVMSLADTLERGVIVEQEYFDGDPYTILARSVRRIHRLRDMTERS